MKIAVTLTTKKQADLFFKYTGFDIDSCGCNKTNWSYLKDTAYSLNKFELGNVKYFEALNYETISFGGFMRIRELTNISDKKQIDMDTYEDVDERLSDFTENSKKQTEK